MCKRDRTGTGTATAANAANTITIARANVQALTLTYTGTGTATVAQAADVLTIARANVQAFSISYTPTAEETATITIDATKVILTIDGSPTNYAFVDGDKDTITKMVAVLDAVSGIACTIDEGAVGATNSNLLDAMTATDLVAAAVIPTYTPTDETHDLTDGAKNTLAEIIAILQAEADLTCIIATGAGASTDSGLLDTLEAADFADGLILTYTPADVTYDLTHGDRNLLSELIAELEAVGDLTCTAVTTHTGNASIQLVAFEAASINTALTLTMNYASFTATYNDIGDPIGVQGWDSLALYVKVDINSSNDPRFRFLGKTEVADTDLFLMDHNRVKCPSATIPATENYIELDSDADQLVEIVIPELYGIAAVQVQVSTGTVGETAGAITSIEYLRTKEGG
jgi:uncharacterized metal-binding protein